MNKQMHLQAYHEEDHDWDDEDELQTLQPSPL